jgi:subtilisin family serine protease
MCVVVRCIRAVCVVMALSALATTAHAQHWVYEGAIVSSRGPTKARAQLAAGLSTIPADFSAQSLGTNTVLVATKRRGISTLEAGVEDEPKRYSRKNNPCKRAKMRRMLMTLSGARCEPNFAQFATAAPDDPLYNPLYENALMSLESAWNISTGSEELVVVVIDSGVLYTHPDLAGNVWINRNEIAGNGIDDDGNSVIDDVYGVNAITWGGPGTLSAAGNPLDDNGHGTHCAGILGARGNNGQGSTGINWRVKIAAAKFLSSSGSGSTSNAIKAVRYATMLRLAGHKVVVTNNSWGGGGYSQALLDAIQAGSAAGIMFIAAAGNAATNTDSTPFYPAALPSDAVISVASVTQTGALSSFSNFGATSVDIAAPGSGIASTYLNNQYAYLSGTSMAAPQISGIVALSQSVCKNQLLTVSQMRGLILGTGTVYSGLSGKVATSAIANADQAVQSAGAVCKPSPTLTPTASPTPTRTLTSTPTATPTPTRTPTTVPSSTPSPAPTATPSSTPPAAPTFTKTPTPSPSATPSYTPTSTPPPTNTPAPAKPIVQPTATSTPASPKATPTSTGTPNPLSISPNKNLTASAQVTIALSTSTTQPRATLKVSGGDGRFIYACPSFTVTLTKGAITGSVTLPSSDPKLNYFELSGTSIGVLQRQRASFKDRVTRPSLKAGTAYTAELCTQIRNALTGAASKKVSAKTTKRRMRVRNL